MMIESTEELLTLLKKMNLKVTSVDELSQLLATINANYNPEAARQRTGKLIGTTVPGYMASAASFATFTILGGGISPPSVGALALVWGPCALVSVAAVITSAIMTSIRRYPAMPDISSDRLASRGEPVVTNIIRELPPIIPENCPPRPPADGG
ncbi:MAG: hypothetical protein ACYC3I_26060 [Gemmataceae bacterium]